MISSVHNQEWIEEETKRSTRFQSVSPEINSITKSIKALIRKGIPQKFREKWWLISAKLDASTANNTMIWKCIKQTAQKKKISDDFFWAPIDFSSIKTEIPSEKLHSFVHIVLVQNPKINFSPMIPFISIYLLTVYPKHTSYFILQEMINRNDNLWYFFTTFDESKTFMLHLNSILYLKCGSISKHAKAINMDITELFLEFCCKFFNPYVSFQISLSIFDAYMNEGIKILIRFFVALFIMYKKQFLQAQTTTEFWSTFIDKLHKLTSPKDFNLWAKYAYDISISRTKQIRHPSKVNKVLKSTSCHNSLNDQIRRSQIIQAIGHFPGKLLNGACFYELTNYFPGSIRFCKPTLVFKMEDNGTSILTMLEHMNSNCSYLLILKTSSGVFGAYLSDPPSKRKERGRFFGNATTFVFSMNPLLVYPGRSSDSISGGFISIDKNSVMIGKPNPAIYFEDQFRMVMSNYCECFHSPAFTPADGADIYDIEIYKLDVGMKRQRSMTFSHEAFIVEN